MDWICQKQQTVPTLTSIANLLQTFYSICSLKEIAVSQLFHKTENVFNDIYLRISSYICAGSTYFITDLTTAMPFWTFPIHIASISSIVLPAERRESLYVL
jgi:hypothetical protein